MELDTKLEHDSKLSAKQEILLLRLFDGELEGFWTLLPRIRANRLLARTPEAQSYIEQVSALRTGINDWHLNSLAPALKEVNLWSSINERIDARITEIQAQEQHALVDSQRGLNRVKSRVKYTESYFKQLFADYSPQHLIRYIKDSDFRYVKGGLAGAALASLLLFSMQLPDRLNQQQALNNNSNNETSRGEFFEPTLGVSSILGRDFQWQLERNLGDDFNRGSIDNLEPDIDATLASVGSLTPQIDSSTSARKRIERLLDRQQAKRLATQSDQMAVKDHMEIDWMRSDGRLRVIPDSTSGAPIIWVRRTDLSDPSVPRIIERSEPALISGRARDKFVQEPSITTSASPGWR
jgi:hypothetical protein